VFFLKGFGWHVIRVDGKGTVPADISAAEFDRRYNDPTERSKLQLVDVREVKYLLGPVLNLLDLPNRL